MHPRKCTNAKELRERLPQWEVRGRGLETMRCRGLEGGLHICSLDQLIPDDYKQALGDRIEVQSYRERLQFVNTETGPREADGVGPGRCFRRAGRRGLREPWARGTERRARGG